jgi:hypothetical protein
VNRVFRLGYSLILFVHGWYSNVRVLFLEVASGSMQRSTGYCYVMCHCQPAAPKKASDFWITARAQTFVGTPTNDTFKRRDDLSRDDDALLICYACLLELFYNGITYISCQS